MNDLGIVTLSNGQVAIVDADDLPLVLPFRWCPMRKGYGRVYAQAHGPRVNGKQSTLLMHTLILGTPKGMSSDHENHDGLDNRRSNLRVCTCSQNLYNRRPNRTHASTPYKGVSKTSHGRYQVFISAEKMKHYLGTFGNPEDGARAYDEAARRLHGEYALTNFAEETTL